MPRKQMVTVWKVVALVAAGCLTLSSSSFPGAGLPQVSAIGVAAGAGAQQEVTNLAQSAQKTDIG